MSTLYKIFYFILLFSVGSELFAQNIGSSDQFRNRYPKQNQYVSDSVTFIWSVRDSSDRYKIQISSDSTFQSISLDSIIFQNNLKTEISYGNYFWRVIALDNTNVIDSTSITRFSKFSIKNTPNLNLWLNASEGVRTNNNQVFEWQDQSDSALLLTQNSTSNQPTFTTNALNGFPAIKFDNTVDFFSNFVNVTDSNYYVSILYSFGENAIRACRLLTGPSSGSNWIIGPYQKHHLSSGGPFISSGATITKDRFVLNSAYSNKTQLYHLLNNITLGSGPIRNLPGVLSMGVTGSNKFIGSVAEVVIVDGAIDKVKIDSIENHLMDKYAPPIFLGDDQIVCQYPVTIHAKKDYIKSYQWNDLSTKDSLVILSEGTYTLTVTDIFGRTHSDSIVFRTNQERANLNLANDTTLCEGDTLRIQLNGPDFFDYQWSDNTNGKNRVLTQSGKYYVTVTECGNNQTIDSINVTFKNPKINLGPDRAICHYDSIALQPDTFLNVSYLWNTGSTDSILLVKNSGLYHLTVLDNFGCSYKDSIVITSDSALINVDLGNDTSLCEGNRIGVMSGFEGYQWSTGDTTAQIEILTTGTYTVTVSNGGCQIIDSIKLTIKGVSPQVSFSYTKLCEKDSIQFTNTSVDPNSISINNFEWDFGNGSYSSMENPIQLFDSSKVYNVSLKVLNDSGCGAIKTIPLTINPKPKVRFRHNTLCLGDTSLFFNQSSIPNGTISSYKWNFGDRSVSNDTSNLLNPSYIFSKDTTYLVTLFALSDSLCIDSLAKSVSVNTKPNASFRVKNPFLNDSTEFINSSSIAKGQIVHYNWDFGNGNTSSLMNPKSSYAALGKYEVSLTVESDSGCFDRFIDSVNIIPSPPPVATFDIVYPRNNQVFEKQVTFIWNDHISAEIYRLEISTDSLFTTISNTKELIESETTIEISAAERYFWRVIAIQNSSLVDTTNVGAFIIFSPKSVSSLSLWLNGDSLNLSSSNKVVEWYDRSDSNRVVVQSNASNQPTFITNGLNGYPVLQFGPSTNFFQNVAKVVDTNYYISVLYSSGDNSPRNSRLIAGDPQVSNWILGPFLTHSLSSGGPFISAGLPIVKDKYALNTAFSKNLALHHFVNGNLLGQGSIGNLPGTLSIGITGSNRFIGNVAEVIIMDGNVSESDRYKTDQFLMDKYAPPVSVGRDRRVCSFPDSLFIESSDYIVKYDWNTGDSVPNIQIDSSGIYILETTDIFGRSFVDSMFYILDTSDYKINFALDTLNLCLGNSFELRTKFNHYDYSWNTGDTTNFISVSNTGNYKVTVQNCLNNTYSDSIFIKFNEPTFTLGNDTIGCFNNPVTLSSSVNFSNYNYLWSTGSNSSTITADSTGLYALQITDQYGCKFKDSVNLTIDSTLISLTLGPDTILCEGNEIGLLNLTTPIKSYLWSNGDVTPKTVVDTAGNYSLTVRNNYCVTSDTINVQIKGKAPSANFNSSNFCLNDSTNFIDNSTTIIGDTLVNWSWDFDNGVSALVKNPTLRFSNPGNYRVLLTVETDKNCFDTISKLITINPLPIANFSFQSLAACSKSPVYHENSSGISSGIITSYLWNFGDSISSSNTSNFRNVFHTYDTTGNYNVSLKVTSDKGCIDSISKLKFINATPNVQFSSTGLCTSDSTSFQNLSVLANGNILDYLWVIDTNLTVVSNNPIYRTKNTSVKFNSIGKKGISLRVRTVEGCQSVGRDTIQIYSKPLANFSVPVVCEGDSFTVISSAISSDSLVHYTYILSNDTFKTPNFKYFIQDEGSFNINLTVSTINGCSDSVSKVVVANAKPQVDFNILNNGTGIPFEIKLENLTTLANRYSWDFGNGDSSNAYIPKYTYKDTGRYELTLTAYSPKGCFDSLTKDVYASVEFLDALLQNVILTENAFGELEISALITNSGFNTINSFKISADINNDFQFIQESTDTLYRGESMGILFNNKFIQDQGKVVDFVCVKIETVNNKKDSITENNILCERAFGNEFKVKTYPNPVENYLSMDYILPVEGTVKIRFFDQSGKQVLTDFEKTHEDGFYSTIVNVISLKPGLYHYSFVFNGITKVGMFLKR